MGNVLIVRVVLKNESMVSSEREGVSKTPISGQDRTALRGVEVNKQISALKIGLPIGAFPSQKEV